MGWDVASGFNKENKYLVDKSAKVIIMLSETLLESVGIKSKASIIDGQIFGEEEHEEIVESMVIEILAAERVNSVKIRYKLCIF